MIEGIKLDVSDAELKQALISRADAHRAKAKLYRDQLANLQSGGVRPQNMTNDPVQSLEASAKNHEQKVGMFVFMADHIIAGETYRLSESDVIRLELIDRYL